MTNSIIDYAELVKALLKPSGIGEPHDHDLMKQAASAITKLSVRGMGVGESELRDAAVSVPMGFLEHVLGVLETADQDLPDGERSEDMGLAIGQTREHLQSALRALRAKKEGDLS